VLGRIQALVISKGKELEMSFTCQHCHRIVVDDRRKAGKGIPAVVQLSPRPNRVVVKRHRDGQIAREEDWCNQCVKGGE
jgi:hypothetical protein